MLLTMHIKNIALIEEIDIDFHEQLNILTGETGAGKSIIIGSLGICLGGKFPKELLRDDTKDGLVELVFSVDQPAIVEALEKLEVTPDEDGTLLISRRLSPNGRTVNRVNDTTVTITRLKEIASLLIDLHAQHEQQTLLKPAKHLEILDRFGGEDIQKLKKQVQEDYHIYRELEEEKKKGSMDEAEKNKRMDFLQYQIKEIKDAKLVDGEDVQLERQYKKAVNAKEILQYANDIYALTGYGATSAGEQLGRAIKDMRRLTELDEELADAAGILEDADGLLSDFNREISEYMKDMEFDEGQFREMESRLDQINSLKAKYGNSISRILESLAAFEKEYDALSGYEEHMQDIEAQWKKQTAKLEESCRVLSEHRRALSEKLCKKIRESLEDMNFNMVRFEMRFETSPNYSANGYHDACFYISTNVGEAMRPLHEVASGGELSRIMLAMKSCLANQDDTPTLVFDEIDVGISGRTAQKVAEKMSILSRQHQVICITHLSQIAAMADAHYLIEKNVENEKTISSIRLLSKEEEIEELARLIGGAKITETTIHTVTEMKGLAEQAKIN